MCLPPQTKSIQRASNVPAAPPKQPEAAYVPPAAAPAMAAAYPPMPQMYAPPQYYPPPVFSNYSGPAYPKYPMDEPALLDAISFADPSLGFGELPMADPAVPTQDGLDFSWFYGRAPPAGSPPSSVPEAPVLSPFEESYYGVPSGEPSDEPSTAEHSPDSATMSMKKQRKRKLASDLSPEELAKTREINRLAAQRHRHIAKQKQSERQERYDAMGARNEKLKQEIQQVSTELNTLKRLVVSMYGHHGPRHAALASRAALPPMALLHPCMQ